MASSFIPCYLDLSMARKSSSVLEYAKTVRHIGVYSTEGGTTDNPETSGSFLFLIFHESSGITILGMILGSRALYMNTTTNGGTTWTGWGHIAITS